MVKYNIAFILIALVKGFIVLDNIKVIAEILEHSDTKDRSNGTSNKSRKMIIYVVNKPTV